MLLYQIANFYAYSGQSTCDPGGMCYALCIDSLIVLTLQIKFVERVVILRESKATEA